MPVLLPKPDPLFSHASLSTLLRDQIHKMENAIDELSDDTFLQNSPDDMIEAISANVHVLPLTLEPAVSQPPMEIRNTFVFPLTSPIDGFCFSVDVPYTGASGLFNHQPDTHDLDKPTARLNSSNMRGSITIKRIVVGDVSPDELRASFEAEIDKIRKYIAWQAIQLDPFNNSLKDEASKIVHGRRDRLLKARHIAASLGYSLPHRQGAPPTYVSPAVRRKIPQIVTTVTGIFQPEPAIEEAEYQNILSIIENMSFVMERNPRVFSSAPEETIRDHYLVQLNGQYEGTATGETFNGVGRTDILVRDGSTNLFVAECKIWHGQKQFSDAIDQLLGYVTWRDTKTALIIFSRNLDTSSVVETARAALEGHANYKRDAKMEGAARMRAVFGRPGDPSRDIILTVIIVPIPISPLGEEAGNATTAIG
jgi:hypothetical protein